MGVFLYFYVKNTEWHLCSNINDLKIYYSHVVLYLGYDFYLFIFFSIKEKKTLIKKPKPLKRDRWQKKYSKNH